MGVPTLGNGGGGGRGRRVQPSHLLLRLLCHHFDLHPDAGVLLRLLHHHLQCDNNRSRSQVRLQSTEIDALARPITRNQATILTAHPHKVAP